MGATVDVRCPHCKGGSFSLYERLEVAHHFRVENGEALEMFVAQELPTRIGFVAQCDCGHGWVPRRSSALKIMDAEGDARTDPWS